MQYLPLQITGIDNIVIDHADGPYAGRGQIQPGRTAESASADQQDLALEKFLLSGYTDLGDAKVSAIALALLGVELLRLLDGETSLLPGVETTIHTHNIRVADLPERLCRKE